MLIPLLPKFESGIDCYNTQLQGKSYQRRKKIKEKVNTYSKHKDISGAKIKIQKETEVSCFNC